MKKHGRIATHARTPRSDESRRRTRISFALAGLAIAALAVGPLASSTASAAETAPANANANAATVTITQPPASSSPAGAPPPAVTPAPAVPGAAAPSAVPAVPAVPSAPAPAPPAPASAAGESSLNDVVVAAPEPRYVAPTRRDRIGRVWAPVYINEQGPFRLVLDTGASSSAITQTVASALGLSTDPQVKVRMFGVTGEARVDAVKADSLRVGDLEMDAVLLPIVQDAFGGAEGVLGNHGMRDKRITIDFRHDRVTIIRSKGQRAEAGMITIPVQLSERGLLVIPARVGDIRTKAIVDTGGQATIGNLALREELERRARMKDPRPDQVVGSTMDVQEAERVGTPPIWIGRAAIRNARITFGEMYIFDHWKMNDEPAMLIGMDVLGLLDVLVIDYRRKELQVLLRGMGEYCPPYVTQCSRGSGLPEPPGR